MLQYKNPAPANSPRSQSCVFLQCANPFPLIFSLTIIKITIMKYKPFVFYLIVFIIAATTLIPVFSHSYFSMHDDQHVARLYLLDQGINQGTLYPRWVDELGFSYGYPLFNFYPPLIYYVAEFFRSIGFGYINSIKLMLLVATLLGALGISK